jgi:hypothetical protein
MKEESHGFSRAEYQFVPNPAFTVSKIAKWGRVTNREHEVDFWTECVFCKGQNRVRLGLNLSEVELVNCSHYLRYDTQAMKREGVLRFTFGQ